MKKMHYVLIVLLMIFISSCKTQNDSVYHLYFMGGQSNMDGYGYNDDLPGELKKEFEDVYIFHGNSMPDDTIVDGRGVWELLRPGHGAGFISDGISNHYSDRFGCEISFAATIKDLRPDEKIAILKYSRGGTSIDEEAAGSAGSWEPGYKNGDGINQYDHFLAAVHNALSCKDINNDGKEDKLIPSGIVWMQGESDADFTEEIALRYYSNLSGLMALIRKSLGPDSIPVVIGRISDSGNDPSGKVWEHMDIVRKAQHQFAEEDANAAIVTTTDSYDYSDKWHYDSEGFIDLGEQFAIKLDSLMN